MMQPALFRGVGKGASRIWNLREGAKWGFGIGWDDMSWFPQLINVIHFFSFLGTSDLHSLFVISVFRTGRHCGGETGGECGEASYCQARHASRLGPENLLPSLSYA